MEKSVKNTWLRIAVLALILLSAVGFLCARVEELLDFWFEDDFSEYIDELSYIALPARWLLVTVAVIRGLLLLPRKRWADILSALFGILSCALVLAIPTILEAGQLMGGLGSYHYTLMPLGYVAAVCCGASVILTVILAIKNQKITACAPR